jgi:DNA-binding NarL/FixJ family response regulator
MTTLLQTAVRVFVVGPSDLVTTAVAAALAAHGFDADAAAPGSPFPTAPGEGGVVVVNLDLPDGAWLVAAAVRGGWQAVAVFRSAEPERAAAAVAAGAVALVPRSASLSDLLDVIAGVAAGRPGMSEQERAVWLDVHRSTLAEVDTRRRRLDSLTEREFEVLQRLERGQRAAEIALDAVVAISTVRTHIRSILVKLEVNSQQHALALYRETSRGGD